MIKFLSTIQRTLICTSSTFAHCVIYMYVVMGFGCLFCGSQLMQGKGQQIRGWYFYTKCAIAKLEKEQRECMINAY